MSADHKTTLVVHCSATPPAQDIGAHEIRQWHVEDNGWDDIGYAYVIRRDGTLEPGRDLDKDGDLNEETGAHAAGFNRRSIGVCLIGGVNSHGQPDANFTFQQYVRLWELVQQLRQQVPSLVHIVGHRDLPGVTKACPCFDVQAFLAEVWA